MPRYNCQHLTGRSLAVDSSVTVCTETAIVIGVNVDACGAVGTWEVVAWIGVDDGDCKERKGFQLGQLNLLNPNLN